MKSEAIDESMNSLSEVIGSDKLRSDTAFTEINRLEGKITTSTEALADTNVSRELVENFDLARLEEKIIPVIIRFLIIKFH
jgi:hypothetical protein